MDTAAEITRCSQDVAYFVSEYCQIKNDDGQWVPFDLWDDQVKALRIFITSKQAIALKARQVGITWLVLAYALHVLIFQPGVTVLLFSLREKEAIEILERLMEMYWRLPKFLQWDGTKEGNKTSFELANDSRALAFPTGTGDSYTAKLAIIDEADVLANDLAKTINSVKPTVDAGGQLFLVSKSNKKAVDSPFKRIYRAAKNGDNDWGYVFLPWNARPGRTQKWYDEQRRNDLATNGNLDFIHENYPATDTESLAPSSSDKRFPHQWLAGCFRHEQPEEPPPQLTHITGLRVYREPIIYRDYVLGVDVAEGNPTSHDSSFVLIDKLCNEEIASFNAKVAPAQLAKYCQIVSKVYNKAEVMVERNNHGHAFIEWWNQNNRSSRLLSGRDGKLGWLSNRKSKTLLADYAAEIFRDRMTIIHTQKALDQLMLLDGVKIAVEEMNNEHGDLAIAFLLALMASQVSTKVCAKSSYMPDWDLAGAGTPIFGVHPQRKMPFGAKMG